MAAKRTQATEGGPGRPAGTKAAGGGQGRPEFPSTEGMPEAAVEGLRHLLMACADTKLLLGYHYGEWTFGTPALEAAIANCSLAQTELGHVRLLHAVLRNQYEDDTDALVEKRAAAEFANVSYLDRPISDWPGFVGANYVVDLAVTRVLHALCDSAFKPVRTCVEKMLDEERYHIHHGQGWFRTLATRDAATRTAVQAAVNTALATVVEWFGPAEHPLDTALVDTGCKAEPNAAILQRLLEDIAETAASLEVYIDVERHTSFEGWDPATRRRDRSGPDTEILQHLRGSKNEMFKL